MSRTHGKKDELGAEPTLLNDTFITGLHNYPQAELAKMEARSAALKEEVRMMLRDCCTANNAEEMGAAMRLVDAVQRLGLGYHFQEELHGALCHINSSSAPPLQPADLFHVSLRFRLLRQAGIRVPAVVFEEFKDETGKFNSSLGDDAKGLLSLYNAAYIKAHGEKTLEEAILFARENLLRMSSRVPEPLKNQVMRYLDIPLWRRMRRLETRYYISEFEMEVQGEKDNVLLKLAKLDYNLQQSLHVNELQTLSVLWREILESGNFSYCRDRIVEMYIWTMGVHSEPDWARARNVMNMFYAIVVFLDDLVDNHVATLSEYRTLDDAIQRWVNDEKDASSICLEPKYLDYIFKEIVNICKPLEDALGPDEKYRVYYLRQALGDYSANQLKELEFFSDRSISSFKDHLDVSLRTSEPVLVFASLVGANTHEVSEGDFRWLVSFPDVLTACAKIGRFMNDIQCREFDKDRANAFPLIFCYMQNYQVSWQEAVEAFKGFTEDAWATLNHALLEPEAENFRPSTPFITQILIDHARILMLIYGGGFDLYTDPRHEMKLRVANLLLSEHLQV